MKTWKKNCNGWDQTKTLKSSGAFFAFKSKSSFLNQIQNVHCIENESALWQNIVKHLNFACGSWLDGGGFQQIAHAIRDLIHSDAEHMNVIWTLSMTKKSICLKITKQKSTPLF